MGKTVIVTLLNAVQENGGYTLHLKDNEGHRGDNNITSQANPGDFVQWAIEPGSNISSIDNVYAKEGSANIFSEGPRKDGDAWVGNVNPEATGSESYNIQYTVDGATVVDDPIIEVEDPDNG